MIKLIIFDLDGVLIDTRKLHYDVLNKVLGKISPNFVISEKEHLTKYDGLSTRKKLEKLSQERGLPIHLHDEIWKKKQDLTLSDLENCIQKNDKIISLMLNLKNRGYKIYVASNSIRKTVEVCIRNLGIEEILDGFLSNEDVISPKPHPEIYMRCIISEKVLPSETLIIEDSYIGRTAAVLSGSNLCAVKNPDEVTLEKIEPYLNHNKETPTWHDDKMNILIPMAGAGSRFQNAGFTFPKPLIEVNGIPMIQLVCKNLNIVANFIFIVRREHYEKYNLKTFLNVISPNCKIVITEDVTEGACCTTLLAEEFIDNNNPLLICNSDQFIEWNSGEFYHSVNSPGIDGSVLIFESYHPKWSYLKVDEDNNVTEIAEKQVISNMATVGVYYWAKGSEYVKYAKKMIDKNIRVNNEFYVAPVYNEAVADGKIIKTYTVEKMWGLGTPEDLEYYLLNNKKNIPND